MNDNYNLEEGMDPGVSDDAFEQDPVLVQYQTIGEQTHWVKELQAADKERSEFHDRGKKYIKRYANERDATETSKKYFNIFFANTEIKQAALYARTPVPDIKRRFNDADDDVSRVAANLLQRNISYELECDGFDAKFKQMIFDRLVPGIGVGWLRFEQEVGEPEMQQTPDPMTGQPLLTPIEGSEIKNQIAQIDYVAWDDFKWSPCRAWTACRWVGRRVAMSKDAVKQRFSETAPPLTLQNLAYATRSTSSLESSDPLKPRNLVEATVDVMEIWDKERRLVFWVCEGADVPLDVQADTNEFPDFFPTPLPPLARTSTSNTTPIADYKLVQDQYNELDDLNAKAANLVDAIQLRWAYDASNPNLKDLYTNTGNLQGVPVKDWMSFSQEKGGIRGSMEFAPLTEVVAAYTQTIAAREAVKAQIYEIEGISDILRGASTRYETAAATNAKGSYSATRLAVMQNEVADYAQRLLRLKAHLICKFYSPQFFMKRAGMVAAPDQQYIPQALQLLRDQQLNHFRLLVSVESIQLPNWDQEKRERNELVGSLMAGLAQVLPAIQQTPAIMPLAMHMIKFSVAGYRASKEVEGFIDNALEEFAQKQAQQGQEPPKPSPAEVKAQSQQQEQQLQYALAQMKADTQLQITQIVEGLRAEAKARDQELEQMKLLLKNKQIDADIQQAAVNAHIDAAKTAHSDALDMVAFVPEGGL